MKKILFLFAFTVVTNVSTNAQRMKFILNEKVTPSYNSIPITIEDNRILLHTTIEGKPQVMRLDLGANYSVLTDTSAIPGYYLRRKATASAKGADRNKFQVATLPLSMHDAIFSSSNKVFTVIQSDKSQNSCESSGTSFAGLYGYDFFWLNNTGLLLDFDKGQLSNLKQEDFAGVIATGFQSVKSSFKGEKITIYITIDGREYPFKFDTGYTGSFVIPAKDDIGFLADDHYVMEGALTKGAAGEIKGTDSHYDRKAVSIGNLPLISTIKVSEGIKAQNVGMGFIKGFNWLIDLDRKEVYFKKRTAGIDSVQSVSHPYYGFIEGGSIVIKVKDTRYTQYKLGSRIVSVNGKPVTSENICTMLNALNSSADWASLKVETKD